MADPWWICSQYTINYGQHISFSFLPKSKNSLLQSFGLVFSKVEMEGFWISWSCQEGRKNHGHNWHGQSSGHSTTAPFTEKIESPPVNNGSLVDQFSPHDHSCHTIHRKRLEIYETTGSKGFSAHKHHLDLKKHTGQSSSCFYINMGPKLSIHNARSSQRRRPMMINETP